MINIKAAALLASFTFLGGVAHASAYTLELNDVTFPGTGVPITVTGGGGEVATFSAGPNSQFESFPNDPSLPLTPGATHLTAGGGASPITIDFSVAVSSITLPIFAYAIDPVVTTVSFYDGARLLTSVSQEEASTLTTLPLFSAAGNITRVTIDTPGMSAGFSLGVQIDPITYAVAGSVSAVPLPASAPLFGAALMVVGVVGYGLKRKPEAAA